MVKRKHKSKAKVAKRKPVKRRKRAPRKRKPVRAKRKPVKRKPAKRKRRVGKRVVKQIERKSVERVMTGARRRRRGYRKRRVVMAGTRRRRTVGKSGGNKLLIGLAIGAAAIYFLTKPRTTTYPGTGYQLPPLASTQNTTRNSQASNLVQYAIAGGLAIDAIIKLIDTLNTSSDQEVNNIYDVYQVQGTAGLEYYA